MSTTDVVLAGVFAVVGFWFLRRNRAELRWPAMARHIIFMVFVYLGSLAIPNGSLIDRWIFGREIHKHDPEEFVAGIIPLIACLLSFACGTIALGKNRVRHFKLYMKTFGFEKPRASK
jgi:hypothetical protein